MGVKIANRALSPRKIIRRSWLVRADCHVRGMLAALLRDSAPLFDVGGEANIGRRLTDYSGLMVANFSY